TRWRCWSSRPAARPPTAVRGSWTWRRPSCTSGCRCSWGRSARWRKPPATTSTTTRPRSSRSVREVAVHVVPAAVLADEAAGLVQPHRGTAADAVAGDEFDHGRVRPGRFVALHRQAEPAHAVVERQRRRSGGRGQGRKQVVPRTEHIGAVARAHQLPRAVRDGGAGQQRAAAGGMGQAAAAGTGFGGLAGVRRRHPPIVRERPGLHYPVPFPRPPAIAMPAPMILSDDRIDRLQDLLELRAVPFGGLGLEGLDGFCAALAAGPEEIPEPEGQAVVWGGPAPRWNDDAEAAEVAALLAQARALAVRRACHDGEVLPDRLLPLLWLPEDPEAPPPDALDAGSEWAE